MLVCFKKSVREAGGKQMISREEGGLTSVISPSIMSNKLRYASPVKRLSKINLLCKQKSIRIRFVVS